MSQGNANKTRCSVIFARARKKRAAQKLPVAIVVQALACIERRLKPAPQHS
jgi:hypothetical protein